MLVEKPTPEAPRLSWVPPWWAVLALIAVAVVSLFVRVGFDVGFASMWGLAVGALWSSIGRRPQTTPGSTDGQ